MSNNICEHPIPRPSGPTRRPSLPRMNDATSETMGKKKGNKTSTPPKKDQNSFKLDEKLESSPVSSRLYPHLPEADTSSVDGPFTSTIGTSNDQSSNESRTNDSSILNDSSEVERSTGVFEAKPVNKSNANSGRKSTSWSSFWHNNFHWFIVVVLACALVIFGYPNFWSRSNKTEKTFEKPNLIENITVLRGLFPTQDNSTWSAFESGIQDVFTEQHRPAIFLLLASHNETTNCLAKKVGELARSTLGGTGDVILTIDKLENNISKVLNLMENRVYQTKAVVILDLLSVQPQAIKAFHDICDEYRPLVAEAVYLFTMRSGIHKESGNLKEVAEDQLTEKFSADIGEDTLKALIVRITSGAVLAINKEQSIPC